MNNNNIAIKLNNVSKRYNVYSRNIDRIKGVIFNREPAEVKHALDSISFNIQKGERVVVFGIVDSGRSTLIKTIAGITKPSSGKIQTIGSENVLLNAKVGFDMEFSCMDNIYLKANIVGLARKEIEPFVSEILEFAEIEKFADLPMKRMPKGTAALLSLAVHLKKKSDILLCDEVFGGGGNYVTSKCEGLIEEYLNENAKTTAVLITNRVGFAKKIATRAIVLDKGKLAFDGKVDQAWERVSEISKRRGKQ